MDDIKPLFGISTGPTTPVSTRAPSLPFTQQQPTQLQQSSSGPFTNGQSSLSVSNNNNNNNINNSNRIYNNNNNNVANTNLNNINNVNSNSSYPPKSSTTTLLAPPPSRANNNNNNITSSTSNNSTFIRPADNKPLTNGRSAGYSTTLKHEVNKSFYYYYFVTITYFLSIVSFCLYKLFNYICCCI